MDPSKMAAYVVVVAVIDTVTTAGDEFSVTSITADSSFTIR
jgi:hypothetical protein